MQLSNNVTDNQSTVNTVCVLESEHINNYTYYFATLLQKLE